MKNTHKKSNIKDESGQSTVEFLITLTVAMGMLFSFLKMAIIYTNGYFVHYVVFQASRAYMVGERHSNVEEGSDSFATDQATEVFESYNLPGIISGFDSSLVVEDPESNRGPSNNLFVGVRANFKQELLIPGSGKRIEIDMQSESYLGMEPTRAECFFSTCRAMQEMGMGTNCTQNATVTDNGC